jgi:hypothetical protein
LHIWAVAETEGFKEYYRPIEGREDETGEGRENILGERIADTEESVIFAGQTDAVNEKAKKYTSKDGGRELAVWSLLSGAGEEVLDRRDELHLGRGDIRGDGDELRGQEALREYAGLGRLREGEYAYVERRFTESKAFSFTGSERIESADDVAYIFSELEDEAVENTFVVYVKDGQATVQHIGIGSFAGSPVDIQQVHAGVSRFAPDEIYFVHNHPSGSLVASGQDMNLYRRFKDVFGDKLREGIIINLRTGKFGTFNDESYRERDKKSPTGDVVDIKVQQFSKLVFDADVYPQSLDTIDSPQSVASYISGHRLGARDKLSFLVMDVSGRVTGNFFLDVKGLNNGNIPRVAKYINEHIVNYGGARAVVYGRSRDDNYGAMRLAQELERIGGRLDDYIQVKNWNNWVNGSRNYGEYRSSAMEGVMEGGERYEKNSSTFAEKSEQEQTAVADMSVIYDANGEPSLDAVLGYIRAKGLNDGVVEDEGVEEGGDVEGEDVWDTTGGVYEADGGRANMVRIDRIMRERLGGITDRSEFDADVNRLVDENEYGAVDWEGWIARYNEDVVMADAIYKRYSRMTRIAVIDFAETGVEQSRPERIRRLTEMITRDTSAVRGAIEAAMEAGEETAEEKLREVALLSSEHHIDMTDLLARYRERGLAATQAFLGAYSVYLNQGQGIEESGEEGDVRALFIRSYEEFFGRRMEESGNEEVVSLPKKMDGLTVVKVRDWYRYPENHLFAQYGLLDIGGGRYQRVSFDETLEELYEAVLDKTGEQRQENKDRAETERQREKRMERLKRVVQRQASREEMRGRAGEDGETIGAQELAERVVLYRMIYGYDKTSPNEKTRDGVYSASGLLDFGMDFYRYMMEEKVRDTDLYRDVLSRFALTSGVEIKDGDARTAREVWDGMPEGEMKDRLGRYAMASRNPQLGALAEVVAEDWMAKTEDERVVDDEAIGRQKLRELYLNNPSLLPLYDGRVVRDGAAPERKMQTENMFDDFVRMDDGVYEITALDGRVATYEKVGGWSYGDVNSTVGERGKVEVSSDFGAMNMEAGMVEVGSVAGLRSAVEEHSCR